MNVADAFKSEVIRPLTTIVVPGAIAIAPYVLVLGYYVPLVFSFWTAHPSAFVTLVAITIFSTGLVLDNFGTHIEVSYIDRTLQKCDPKHDETWRAYLGLRIKDEYVGQRYLRQKVERLKFELSMAPAMLSFAVGLTWLQWLHGVWRWPGFVGLLGLLLLGSYYFLREAYKTACVLADTRKILVRAVASAPDQTPNSPLQPTATAPPSS